MNETSGERCGNCRFWHEEQCRRRAPIHINALMPWYDTEDGADYEAIWPETAENEWCGEWEGKH
jgi:hypothetical protein